MKEETSKVLITGATGWLGTESVARIHEGSFKSISANDLILSSSDGRDLTIDSLEALPTEKLKALSGFESNTKLNGFVHLAFLTKDKVEKYGFSDYVAKNIELISAACEIIERDKPKWVVVVSSGAIIDRESLAIENNVMRNPYGFCKRIEEALLSEAARKVGANIVIGRLWGSTGLYMPINRAYAISDFIESAKESGEIKITSGGEVIRRYCDAGDFMEVLIKSAIRGDTKTVDSGGQIIELGDLATLVSAQMRDTSISRSSFASAADDYYPRGSEFEDLAASVGVELRSISEQVARTLKSHKVINVG
jgi:nucleoside-diphosphate-sugar epimerase